LTLSHHKNGYQKAMPSAYHNYEKEIIGRDIESSSEGKGQSHHVDNDGKDVSGEPAVALHPTRTFEAPEWIRNLTPEERLAVETRLKRKIDLRLLPMIVLMYIMNYLDRVRVLLVLMLSDTHGCRTILLQQNWPV
jgi:hypothetical protein